MGIKQYYSKWPLRIQLQITFITAITLLTTITVIITKLQLDWLYEEMVSGSLSSLESSVVTQMRNLSSTIGHYVTSELSQYIYIVSQVRLLNEIAFETSNLTKRVLDLTVQPLNSYDDLRPDEVRTNRSAYHGYINNLSKLGNQTVYIAASLDQVLPFMQNPNILGLYEGYAVDEILNFSPASYFSGLYTPVVREWYYRAIIDPKHQIITEPYLDATGAGWVFTVSQAIMNSTGIPLGVAATDLLLRTFTEKIRGIAILETGFSIIVSYGGIILTQPSSWEKYNLLRIYNQSFTGISASFWDNIKKAGSGTIFDYKDMNGTEYIMVVEPIKPFVNNETTTHIILLFANRTDLHKPIEKLNKSYNDMYAIIFWFVLIVAFAVLVVLLVLIYINSNIVQKKLYVLEKFFITIIQNSLFPRIVKPSAYSMLKDPIGVEELYNSTRNKVNTIQLKEESYNYYKWGLTRPKDQLLYSNWEDVIYPFNYYHGSKMVWKESFKLLEDITHSPAQHSLK